MTEQYRFELLKTGNNFEATVYYVGNDEEFKRFYMEQNKDHFDNYKLLVVELSVNNNDKKHFKYNLFLHSFYNIISKYNLSEYNPLLKKHFYKAGRILLLTILCYMLKASLCNSQSVIFLEASGSIHDSDDMSGLVKYYESLGFRQAYPEKYLENVQNFAVPMFGRVEDILANCDLSGVSEELLSIIPVEICNKICRLNTKAQDKLESNYDHLFTETYDLKELLRQKNRQIRNYRHKIDLLERKLSQLERVLSLRSSRK